MTTSAGGGGVHVAPRDDVLAQHVRVGPRVVRAERRILDERRAGARAAAIVTTAGSSSYSTRTRRAASSAASCVSAATAATGSPWYFVSPTAITGRSLNCGPKRGIGCGRSAAVITRRTPGTRKAPLESIAMMRPRAQGSVTSLTCSSSGRWMSAT